MATDTPVSAKVAKLEKDDFSWTEKEIKLLLDSLKEYKAEKLKVGIDFESVKEKWEDVLGIFLRSYPAKSKEFPRDHPKQIFTKDRMAQKAKRIRQNFRKAVDAGKRSGGGRIVTEFFDICEEIWAGCAGTEPVEGAIESSQVGDPECEEIDELPGKEERSAFYNQRGNRLQKKQTVERQLLTLAQQEITIKEESVKQQAEANKRHEEQIQSLERTISAMNSTMQSGFAMLQQALIAPAPPPRCFP